MDWFLDRSHNPDGNHWHISVSRNDLLSHHRINERGTVSIFGILVSLAIEVPSDGVDRDSEFIQLVAWISSGSLWGSTGQLGVKRGQLGAQWGQLGAQMGLLGAQLGQVRSQIGPALGLNGPT